MFLSIQFHRTKSSMADFYTGIDEGQDDLHWGWDEYDPFEHCERVEYQVSESASEDDNDPSCWLMDVVLPEDDSYDYDDYYDSDDDGEPNFAPLWQEKGMAIIALMRQTWMHPEMEIKVKQ